MFVEKFQRHTRVCVPHTNLDRLGINLSTHGKKEKEKKKGGEKKSGHSRKSLVGQRECGRTSCARPYASRALDRSRPYRGNCIAAGECAGGFEISNFQSWFSPFNCWPRCDRNNRARIFISFPSFPFFP